jgi:hypothetical protein
MIPADGCGRTAITNPSVGCHFATLQPYHTANNRIMRAPVALAARVPLVLHISVLRISFYMRDPGADA